MGAPPGRADELFAFPAPPTETAPRTPDSVEIDRNGRVVVLRIPTLGPPTADHPALVLSPDQSPTPLAPWSTLAPAAAPECRDHAGYRAVVMTSQPWVRVGRVADYDYHDEQVLALQVSWSRERVCLEAAEVPVLQRPDEDPGSYLVARLGQKPSAGRIFVGEGFELWQPFECELEWERYRRAALPKKYGRNSRGRSRGPVSPVAGSTRLWVFQNRTRSSRIEGATAATAASALAV